MANFKKLKSSRVAARGWVTRSSKSLLALLDKPKSDVSCLELEDAIEELDKRLSTLDDIQSSLEAEISDSEELEKDIEDSFEFHTKARLSKVQAADRLAAMVRDVQSPKQSSSGSVSSNSSCSASVRLPKLELPNLKAS